ncbi:MAG: transcriptional repressor [Anaerolineales bacterium]|nr:transcriptional repressor [Anaerolineales bacterium]
MSCITTLTRTLRQRGYRMTPQRLAILQALHDVGHLTPAQVYARVRATGMTEATVYRTLDFLAENDVVRVADRGSGHLAYELAGEDHHHLICRACGAQQEIPAEVLRGMLDALEGHTGYRLNAGHLTFFGLCPICQESFTAEPVYEIVGG